MAAIPSQNAGASTAARTEIADVVIIGGGVIGTSIAYYLAAAGVPRVMLLERGTLGCGSTCRAIGGIRTSFGNETNIRLGRHNRQAYASFATVHGQDIDLTEIGYLYLVTEEADLSEFERCVELQRAHGVDSRMITPREAQRLSPHLDPTGLRAAVWTPRDAIAAPEAVVQGYARSARAHGAQVRTGVTVTAIERAGDGTGDITAVHTSHGPVATGTVVIAAGAWSAQVGALAGVDLPVTPVRRQVVFTEPLRLPRPSVPLTVEIPHNFYYRYEGNRLLLGYSDPHQEPGYDARYQLEPWLSRMVERMAVRTPELLDVGLDERGWAGLYEVTPDHNQIVGEFTRPSRLLYATGFSGHGFQMGPAVGTIVRDLYLGVEPLVDVGPMSIDRFTGTGTQLRSEAVAV
ncbi:FAD-binding oxidoreductase [Lipingzhangella sp. LS1_29]|uniref:FAD-binding oxidoreductase n=1 Tax=Lipingzhangella rawalii TaxID=2055835 RepID=A0ABU2HBB1_9ACTN|nr:FAD-binding oxidoreductase [Lipingzhangella rawalii]MDS1272607.1 FAD-binding oxidoreductase [Lipingzhangella rawalii]